MRSNIASEFHPPDCVDIELRIPKGLTVGTISHGLNGVNVRIAAIARTHYLPILKGWPLSHVLIVEVIQGWLS